MKTFISIIICLLILSPRESASQQRFRSGLFFHHSTGENIWGPNGCTTSVPIEMTRYNTLHGYTGQLAVTMNETWFPVNYDNEWATWHTIFATDLPEAISGYFASNKIIMIKSCFPSSAIEERGQPVDTLSPDYKTIYNYKWHWRSIINVMKNRPQNFFVIWTNAPLTQQETTPNSALLSKEFCKWAKDTLAQGRDPVFGAFPGNVYVFDFFSKLTNSSGYLQPQYAVGPNDPHPNSAATALIAPLLVNEVFDHSIAYESIFGIIKTGNSIPFEFSLSQNYPNPFNPSTTVEFSVPVSGTVKISLFDTQGKEVLVIANENLSPGNYTADIDASTLSSGTYFCVMRSSGFCSTRKMVLLK